MSRRTKVIPSKERLRELFDYDRETGNFLKKGTLQVANWESYNTYHVVTVDGIALSHSRCVYQWHHGNVMLVNEVDHIFPNVTNNRIENLRLTDTLGNHPSIKRQMMLEVYKRHEEGDFDCTKEELFAKTPDNEIEAYLRAKKSRELRLSKQKPKTKRAGRKV